MTQLVEALPYEPEGRGFPFAMLSLEFFILQSFQPHYGPAIDSVYSRNDYQEYLLWGGVGGKGGLCLGLTSVPHSRADCIEIWEPKPPGNLRVCPGLSKNIFTFALLLPPMLVFRCFVAEFYVVLQRERSSETDDGDGKARRWSVLEELERFTVMRDRPILKNN